MKNTHTKSPPPKTLTILEAEKILDGLLRDYGTEKSKRTGLRNYLIGLLMLDAGLRVGEVVRLRIIDLTINNEARHALIIGEQIGEKGCYRTIPLTQRIQKAIDMMDLHYWCYHGDLLSNFAFTAPGRERALTTRQVERILSAASLTAIGRHVNPHVLRHTFATRLMQTCNIRVVQMLLGHKNLTSTQVYTHPNQDHLTQAINSLNTISHSS